MLNSLITKHHMSLHFNNARINSFNIGLFGLGVVGSGFLSILEQTPHARSKVSRICVQDPKKTRQTGQDRLHFNPDALLDDPEINLIIETINGVEEAFYIVKRALEKRKPVITVNKKMLAHYLPELLKLQTEYKTPLLYEGAVCGSIPIIRTLDEHFATEPLSTVEGIFNGTSNYILTRMQREGLDFETALRNAQELGYAELDPSSDIDGEDAKFKLILMGLHSHGHTAHPDQVLNLGIRHLRPTDLKYALNHGGRIKLLPHVSSAGDGGLRQYVMPALVPEGHQLHGIDYEFNAVRLEGPFAGEQFFRGRGAGSLPTGSAIIADLNALQQGFQYQFHKHRHNGHLVPVQDEPLEVYLSMPLGNILPANLLAKINSTMVDGDLQVLRGQTSIECLKAEKSWIMENKVFVMQV